MFRYAKIVDNVEIDTRVEEMPIDILLTEFHYFLLHEDSLTILSRINERVVEKYDLKHVGIAVNM